MMRLMTDDASMPRLYYVVLLCRRPSLGGPGGRGWRQQHAGLPARATEFLAGWPLTTLGALGPCVLRAAARGKDSSL